MFTRREILQWLGSIAATSPALLLAQETRLLKMYGIIGKMIAVEGRRDELATILIDGIANMPGCKSYIVANDSIDANALWITEVWEDQEKHAQSLSLPSVIDAITKGRPLIAGFGERFETEPLGGQGIL